MSPFSTSSGPRSVASRPTTVWSARVAAAEPGGAMGGHRSVLNELGTARGCFEAHDRLVGEVGGGTAEEVDGLQQVVGDEREHGVELEVPTLAGEGYGGIVTDDLRRDHHGALGDDGVDLARHGGGARLDLGEG